MAPPLNGDLRVSVTSLGSQADPGFRPECPPPPTTSRLTTFEGLCVRLERYLVMVCAGLGCVFVSGGKRGLGLPIP